MMEKTEVGQVQDRGDGYGMEGMGTGQRGPSWDGGDCHELEDTSMGQRRQVWN